MDWLDNCGLVPDPEVDKFLQQHILDLQGSRTSHAGTSAASTSPPPWIFGNAPSVDSPVYCPTEPAQYGSYAHLAFQPPAEAATQAGDFCYQDQHEQAEQAWSGPASRTSVTKSTAAPGKRSEAWTAKNRRAQKKFREKQKLNKGNMQQQLAEMTAQLQALETEHDQLTGKNAMLEKVLHVRQLQLEILQDQQQTTQTQPPLTAQWQGQVPLPCSQQKASDKASDEAPAKTPGFALTSVPHSHPPAADINATYAGIVEALREILSKIDKDGLSPDLETAVKQQGDMMGHFVLNTVLSNTENLRKLYMVNIDPEDWETTDLLYRQPQHWQAVTDCLQLTAEQQSEMIRLRAECLAKQGDNQAEWQQLCSAIAEATVGDPSQPECQGSLSLDAKRLLALRATLHKGQQIWLELYKEVFSKVWDCVQYARAVVRSGPHHIDVMAIASCVAHQAGAS